MAQFKLETTEADAETLSATIHKLRAGDRTEPVDLDNTPLTPAQRSRAQAKLLSGTLARTTGHSTPVLDAGEIRVLIDGNLVADLATHGNARLTGPERALVAQAIANAVERGGPAPLGAVGAGRGNNNNNNGSIIAGRP